MSVLAIETSSEQLGVALVDERRVVASYEVLAGRTHAVELPKAVTRVLDAGQTSWEALDGIAIDIGPGSFTGLRIGLAFVKAVTFRFRRPVIAVPSLDVLAANVSWSPNLICPMVDAKQRKVYAACYRAADGQLQKVSDYELKTPDAIASDLPQEPILLLGDGAALYRTLLTERLGARGRFAAPELSLPRAAILGRLGLERLRQGLQDDPKTLVPMYLHPHDCTIRRPAAGSPSSP